MKRVLFIDRDGTLNKEPSDEQVDCLAKVAFVPKVFQNMSRISKLLDYELALVSNQDGLGTKAFPTSEFEEAHQFIMQAFENEGVHFNEEFIDEHFPEDNHPNRKPGVGMLKKYIDNPDYNLKESYVIGDRLTDMQLAKNLGAKGILLSDKYSHNDLCEQKLQDTCVLVTSDWDSIYKEVARYERTAYVERKTKETQVKVQIDLDGNGEADIETGLGFFDHMLEQIAKHAEINLAIRCKGDLQIDEHHTIEDTALALGEAFKQALGSKLGIERYGYCLPMDDCLCQCVIDFGGRPWLVWEASFKREKIGDMPTEMFVHFFKSFSDASLSNINIKAEGDNEHHKIEGIFKALARAIKMAIKHDVYSFGLPSTKGVI